MLVQEQVKAGPALLVDAGNALFEHSEATDARAKAKAELILRTMGELKTAAMAPGLRDLALGPDFLVQTARKAGVPLISANLTRDSKPLLPASAVVSAGGVKIGLVGISPALPPLARFPGVRSEPPVKAALAEAKKLRGKVDLVVVLGAISLMDAVQLTKEGGAVVDLVLQSGELRPVGMMQKSESAFILSAGERGRVMGLLDLDLSGAGPLVDLAEIDRSRSRQRALESQVNEVKRRMDAEKDPAAKKSLQQAMEMFDQQLKALRGENLEQKTKGARSARLNVRHLDETVPSDPELKAQVDRLQPPS